MAKEAVVQVRMDAELKKAVEQLYKSLGTSFAEAVRIFAQQSLVEQGMPFKISKKQNKAFGMLSQYANPELICKEEGAMARAMVEKYGKGN